MKRFLLLPFLFFVTVAHAKNYYISASGSDSNNGLTIATPWQSITKVNAAVFVTGDSILFKTGDNFYGTLTPTAGGITIGAYGAGAKPVITGLTTISSWTSIGANIWEAVVPGGLSTLNMVVINGVLTPMGRWPNANTANSGYATYESSVVNVSLTDLQLTASPNWTGGEVVFRRHNYTSDRAKITNHTGNTIAFSTYAGVDMIPGYGYFVENHLSTLDQNGEWYYDPVTKKIKIYFTTTPPSIQVATLTNLVKLVFSSGTGVKSNITIKDISFKGCEGVMMNILWSNNLIVDNCNFSFAGINAIEYNCVNYLTIKNSTISDINMIGIQENASTVNTNVTIQNNVIRRIGINAGMISNAYGEGCSSIGVNVGSPNLLVKENVLDSIGYNGISLKANRNNQIVRKNIITNFCSVKNEGGAIYNSGLRGDPAASNIIIDSNFISKGVGALGGTTDIYNKRASAIFMDATSYGVNILNNTIFDTWDGIGISQAQNIVIKGNTIYNTGNSQPKLNLFSTALLILDAVDGYQHVRANTITNNIFFSKYPDQLMYYQTDRYNGVGSAGVIDYNYYANPWTDFPTHRTNTTAASVINLYSLKMWQSAFPVYDVHSKGSPVSFPLNTVTTTGANKSTNETFNSNTTGWVASSSPVVHTLTWDNTSQITGTGSAKLTSSVSGTNFTSFYNVIGAVDAAKKYVLRFKTKASKLGTFNTYLQQWNGSYAIITSAQSGTIGTDIEQHEIIFSGEHSTQTNAAVFIQFSQNASDVYIDDVQFYEAAVIPTNVDDYIRFEYNPTNSTVTIPLTYNYMGVDSTVYNGSITLQPYTSKILLKNGTATLPPPPLTATALEGATSCIGTTNTVTVSALGGTAPYTNTGAFNANAGKGSLKISFPSSVSTSSTVVFAAIGPISAGKNYVLRFSTLGTTTNGQLNVYLRKSAAPSTQLDATTRSNTYGTSRVDHQFIFTPTIADVNGRFEIEINQSSGTTYIDNIAFFEAASTGNLISSNLYNYGQFETDINNIAIWSSNNNQIAQWDNTAKIKSTYYYTVSDATGAKSTVGLTSNQAAAVLTAVATAGTITTFGSRTTVTVTASGGTAPYTGIGTFTALAGTSSYTVSDAYGCSKTVTVNISQPAARIANINSLSSATLTTTETTAKSTSTPNTVNPLKINSFPNPTATEFGLIVEGGSNEKIEILVINTYGVTLYRTTGATNNTYKFGNSFLPGLYIIRVIQGNTVLTLKVIKA